MMKSVEAAPRTPSHETVSHFSVINNDTDRLCREGTACYKLGRQIRYIIINECLFAEQNSIRTMAYKDYTNVKVRCGGKNLMGKT